MDKSRLFDALFGLYIYDTGSTDYGIHDEKLRSQVIEYLDSLPDSDFRIIMTEFIREYFVCEDAVAKGYGIKEVKDFINWLSNWMHINI